MFYVKKEAGKRVLTTNMKNFQKCCQLKLITERKTKKKIQRKAKLNYVQE